MKFAITATDRYLGICEGLVTQGWEPLKLFTLPVDQRIHHNQAVVEWAGRRGLDIQLSRLSSADLADLARRGCEVLVIASYRWRIVDWRPHLPYAINFHPSPLPIGRGPYPIVPAILGGCTEWGVSCHRLEQAFDSGPVLARRTFALAHDECHDSLDLKVQLAFRTLVGEVAGRFQECWNEATPQGTGSYFPPWTNADRTLDFSRPVAWNLLRVRAFGPLESLAVVDGVTLYVQNAVGWTETHGFAVGSVVHVSALRILIALPDGFLGLVSWSIHSADVPGGVRGGRTL